MSEGVGSQEHAAACKQRAVLHGWAAAPVVEVQQAARCRLSHCKSNCQFNLPIQPTPSHQPSLPTACPSRLPHLKAGGPPQQIDLLQRELPLRHHLHFGADQLVTMVAGQAHGAVQDLTQGWRGRGSSKE